MSLLDPLGFLTISILAKNYNFSIGEAFEHLVAQIAPIDKLSLDTPTLILSSAPAAMSETAPSPKPNHGEKGEETLKRRLSEGKKIKVTLFDPTTKERTPTFLSYNGPSMACLKAPPGSKADIVECVKTDDGRTWKPSVKTVGKGKSTLMNHTGRHAPAFHYERFREPLKAFDDAADQYWSRDLPEDVNGNRYNSPWHWPSTERTPEAVLAHRQKFLPILRYFLVEGSGKGPSKFEHQADCLLIYDPRTNECTIVDLSTQERQDNYLLSIYNELTFSIRKKSYDTNTKARTDPRSHPWADPTKNVADMGVTGVRGALHVRLP